MSPSIRFEKQKNLLNKNQGINDDLFYKNKPGAREDRKKKVLSEKKNISVDGGIRPITSNSTLEFEVLLKKKKNACKVNPMQVNQRIFNFMNSLLHLKIKNYLFVFESGHWIKEISSRGSWIVYLLLIHKLSFMSVNIE